MLFSRLDARSKSSFFLITYFEKKICENKNLFTDVNHSYLYPIENFGLTELEDCERKEKICSSFLNSKEIEGKLRVFFVIKWGEDR